MPKRIYSGTDRGTILTLYIAPGNIEWLRERRKAGDSMSGIVNRALLLLRNLEAVSYAADANMGEDDDDGRSELHPAGTGHVADPARIRDSGH